MKKNFALVMGLLLNCALFKNCFAGYLEELEEILRFCSTNGQKYVALLDQGVKAYQSSMKLSLRYDLRIKSFAIKENLALGTMDTLIVQKEITSLQFDDIFEIMNTRKRQKSILVVRESEVEDFKVSLASFVLI